MSTQTTSPQSTDTDLERAAALAEGLHKLAEFVAANPELSSDLTYALDRILVSHNSYRGDAREYMARYARAGARFGAEVSKDFDPTYANLDISFGAVSLHIYASRGEVCERVVVGTREVEEQVPDPEALAAVPVVTVTKTVEDVEWVCTPLLAEATDDAQSGRAA